IEPFLTEVRRVNEGLPPEERIRVLAGDPPIDWSRMKRHSDVAPIIAQTEAYPADLIGREVLAKGSKALVIYGAGHLWRNTLGVVMPNQETLAGRIDKQHPGSLFTVIRLSGVYPVTDKLESLIGTARRPLFVPLRGTPIGALDANSIIARDLPVRLF